MKYIIVIRHGMETAILFPEHVNHSDAINKLDCPPISAGFCSVKNGAVTLEDRASESLQLKPRPADAEAIETTLALMGLDSTTRGYLNSLKHYFGGFSATLVMDEANTGPSGHGP